MHVTRNSPNYGKGVVSIEGEFIDECQVRLELEATFNDPKYKPPTLPSVAVELLSLSQDPKVDFARIGKVLEKDAIITGQVLRIAQSPVYAGRVQVKSIQQALSRLGLRTLRDLVLQVAMNARVFRSKPYQKTMESLKRHASAVAHICRTVSRYTAMEGEYAFLCGLMHDVGFAGALIALAEGNRSPPSLEDAWSAIDSVHPEASRLMVESWELPPDVVMAVGAHHSVLIQGYPHPMAATIRLADEIADDLGYAIDSDGAPSNNQLQTLSFDDLLGVLALTSKQVDLIRADAEKTLGSGVV